jgi:hypothetical protein
MPARRAFQPRCPRRVRRQSIEPRERASRGAVTERSAGYIFSARVDIIY